MISSTQRFSSRVEYYVKARPKYPAALLRFFQSDLGLSPMHTIADIGSGTGFLTELFVRNGNPTYAVEPNGPMRAAAEEYLKEWSNFHSIDGTAEATTLADASLDFVTAGQAFHWFDVDRSAQEFRRILKPGGIVALIWNERLDAGSRFMIEFDQLIRQYRKETVRDDHGEADIQRFFGSVGFQIRQFENPQMLNRAGLVDRVASSSYMPLPGNDGYGDMLKSIHALFDKNERDGTVRILHETRVYCMVFGR